MNVNLVGRQPTRPERYFLFAKTLAGAAMSRHRFRGVERYCMFIGYPRSSHSLIGALIDAHPNAVVSHELDALDYFTRHFSRSQLFQLIVESSEQFQRRGNAWTGYSYAVPDQHQGTHQQLQVIGDKKGGGSNRRLAADPSLLARFQRYLGMPLHVLHVVRNPFDNIATAYQRDGGTLGAQIDRFASYYRTAEQVSGELGEQFITIHSEEFVTDTVAQLSRVTAFLGLDATDDYLSACAGIVYGSPKETRHGVDWSQEDREAVETLIDRYSFLDGYRFAD